MALPLEQDALRDVLKFLSDKLAKEALSGDAEDDRKRYVDLLERLQTRSEETEAPPDLPPRPVGFPTNETVNGDLPDNVTVSSFRDSRRFSRVSIEGAPSPSLVNHDGNGDDPSSSLLSVYWSGFLALGKRKRSSGPITWNRRWCVLRDDTLYCYMTCTEQTIPQAEYPLRGAHISIATPRDVDKPHAVKIVMKSRGNVVPVFFAVYMAEDMADCMKALKAASLGVSVLLPPPPPSVEQQLPPPPLSSDFLQQQEPGAIEPEEEELYKAPPPPRSLVSIGDGQANGPDRGPVSPFRARANTAPALEMTVNGGRLAVPAKGLLLRRKRSPLEEPESVYAELNFREGENEASATTDRTTSPVGGGGGGTVSDGEVFASAPFKREVKKGDKRGSGRKFRGMFGVRRSKRNDSELRHSADEMSATELEDATASGYLMKKMSSGSSWKKRWCVVKDRCFYYFRSQFDVKPQLAVVLRGWMVSSAEREIRRNFAFKLSHNGILPYYFAADSADMMQDWISSLQLAIGLETKRGGECRSPSIQSAPATPARTNLNLSTGNDMAGEQLLKAVQKLATSPTSPPPPLPSRGSNSQIRLQTAAATTDSMYDTLGPPRPLPTQAEMMSPRLSMSSLTNDDDLYDVPRFNAGGLESGGEGLYSVPRTQDSESGNEDIDIAYEPLNLKLPPREDSTDGSKKKVEDGSATLIEPDAGTSDSSPDLKRDQQISPFSESAEILARDPSASLTSLPKTSEDEGDGFLRRRTKLPSKLDFFVTAPKGGVVNIASLKSERPPRPSSIASAETEIEGFLNKRGPLRRWVRHYCKVRYKKFYCYKTKDHGLVTEFRLLTHQLAPPPKDVKRPFCFVLQSRNPGLRTLVFNAETKEDYEQWHRVLHSAVSIEVETVDDVEKIHLRGGGPAKSESLQSANRRWGSRDEIDFGSMSAPEETPTLLDETIEEQKPFPHQRSSSTSTKKAKREGRQRFFSLPRGNKGGKKSKNRQRPSLSNFDFDVAKRLHEGREGKETVQKTDLLEEEAVDELGEVPLTPLSALSGVGSGGESVKTKASKTMSDVHETVTVPEKQALAKRLTDPVPMKKELTRARGGSFLDTLRRSFRKSKGTKPKMTASRTSSGRSVISGYLYVQKKVLTGGWMKRWCLVQDTDVELLCFREMKDSKPTNVINLVGASVQVFETGEEDSKNPQFMFCVVPGSTTDGERKPLLFRTDNPYDLETWANALQKHIRRLQQGSEVQLREEKKGRENRGSVVLSNPLVVSIADASGGGGGGGGGGDGSSSPLASSPRKEKHSQSGEPPDPPCRPLPFVSSPSESDVYVEDRVVQGLFKMSQERTKAPKMVKLDPLDPYYINPSEVDGPRVTSDHPYVHLVDGGPGSDNIDADLPVDIDGDGEYLQMGDDGAVISPADHGRRVMEGGASPAHAPSPSKETFLDDVPLSASVNLQVPSHSLRKNESFEKSPSPGGSVVADQHEGWLLKKGVWGAWPKHYFRISNGKLLEFKNETTTKPERSVKLSDSIVEDLDLSKDKQRRFVFKVTPHGRGIGLVLGTHSLDEKSLWMSALRRCALKKPNQTLISTDSEGDVHSDIPMASGESPNKPPRRAHTFNVHPRYSEFQRPRRRRKSKSSSPEPKEGKKVTKARVGAIVKGAYKPRGKASTLPATRSFPRTTSGSDADLSSSITSISSLRMSFGKGKKRKNAAMIEKLSHPASSMEDAYFKGYLNQKVSMTGWTKRWCALKDLCFHIYRHPEDRRPLETVILPGWEVHLTTRGKKRNVIKLWHSQMKSMYFTADHRSFVNWFTCLQEAAVVRGGVGTLAAARVKQHSYSSSSFSSYDSFEGNTGLSGSSTASSLENHNSLTMRFDEKVEDVNVKHTAIHLDLFAQFETNRIERDECAKQLEDVKKDLNGKKTELSGSKWRKLQSMNESCEKKLIEIEARLQDVEIRMKENEEMKLAQLTRLEEEHQTALEKCGYLISNVPVSDSNDGTVAYVKKRDLPDDTPPHNRRPSMQAIGQMRVQEQVQDIEKRSKSPDSDL